MDDDSAERIANEPDLGIPGILEASRARELRKVLRAIWEAQIGAPPRTLTVDLPKLDEWFDPTRPGKQLRESLAGVQMVPLAPDEVGAIPAGLLMEVGHRRWIVTPEGRAALHILEQMPSLAPDGTLVAVMEPTRSFALAAVIDYYGSHARRRLDGVMSLLGEEGAATLRPAAAGLLLFLLVNRNTSSDRPLDRSREDPRRARLLTRLISEPVTEFARPLARSNRDASQAVDVYRGWAYGEIARRLGSGFLSGRERAFIVDAEAAEDLLIAYVVNRADRLRDVIQQALDNFFESFGRNQPTLTAMGASYERPGTTSALRTALIRACSGADSARDSR